MTAPRAEPFFLKTSGGPGGPRFCLFHPPTGPARAALLYLHPFAEEMNKSRRMAALAARRLAAQGVGVLQLDLHGCGDSGGEFGDARWDGWKDDVRAGLDWLRARLGVEPGLWGLRLGALLALDYAAGAVAPPARLLLWQPTLGGAACLTQFLRLRLAGELLQDGPADGADSAGKGKGGSEALRARLRAGETLEIAGYELHPALALALDGVDAGKLPAPRCPVDWFEVVAESGRAAPPAAARVAGMWRDQGADLRQQAVAGPQFWTAQEIEEAPLLLDATAALYLESTHAL
ncbi:hydrolase 2, exosortase A system-associated [Massilia sp. ST3]|uniref:hydrolase 2, exosortase A system-associated n=1 Tax=Massilia sp. ST3 TaxID=2824903 RepID=UPI001B837114|nr:hydrolase 2, exosortase A system-associated [Massilia sp. ST3]MBQ5947400.1 hydrolase 2, exosortase A system-associated [Massilia sp. ST3]